MEEAAIVDVLSAGLDVFVVPEVSVVVVATGEDGVIDAPLVVVELDEF